MRPSRPLIMLVRAAFAIVILVSAPPGMLSASAGALRLIDGDGVIHFTNVPGDPRYRDLPGASATTSGGRPKSAYPRSSYTNEIHEISRQYDVDPVLVQAVVRVESAFDPSVVSRKGAGGLMQLMPRTASALGVFDRFDPRENIGGGVRHLRYLLDRYGGNIAMAIAAYNAGEGAVDLHRGIPPYPETEQYVRRVLREANGAEARGGSSQRIYRSSGPDGSLIFSNLPPGIRRPVAESKRGH